MRVPLAWLREFVPTDLAPDDLADRMTHRGVKVEGLIDPWAGLAGVIVVRVVEVRDHPDSDTLCLATVHDGTAPAEVVVGIRNMRPGDLVPWAPPGSRVPVSDSPLAAKVIRGVTSHGMLCSPHELQISQDHGGILILDPGAWEPGMDLRTALHLDEPVLDIEVEPNRPDLLSVHGVAREVSALTGIPLIEPDLSSAETDERAADVLDVSIEAPEGCPRYTARIIRGVRPATSPLQVQARLTACGMRPIDAVVDATNYAMLELGQPLHGFDLARLSGPSIVVRRAAEGERMVTLDDVDRALTTDDLLICDLEGPVALAGVMGGRRSEVSGSTTDVALESASFTRGGVLLTARRLGLHSEASHRFERGVDPEAVDRGAIRGAALIAAWTGATVAKGFAEAGETPPRRWVSVRAARAAALLGYPVSAHEAAEVFDTLGLRHRPGPADALEVEVPGSRPDIEREVDLIEEIVRVQGYDKVGATLPRSPHAGGVPAAYHFTRTLRGALVAEGLREIRPLPFASDDDLAMFADADAVPVANPLRAEEGWLRTRLTPGLLRAVARNRALGVDRVALFEVGTTFRLADPFTEHRKLGFVLAGSAEPGWAGPRRSFDVWDATGIIERLFAGLRVEHWSWGGPPAGPFHPGRAATVMVGDRHAGVVGEIHPRVATALDLEGRVSVGVLGLGPLYDAVGAFAFRDVPRFPPLLRDLAFIVPEDTQAGTVRALLVTAAGPLLDSIELFDVYSGDAVPTGAKSLAFRVGLRAEDRTLSDTDAEPVFAAMVEAVATGAGGELRAGGPGSRPPGAPD
jgi:phenylalanyl-tRNA synthetase beta chain